MAASRRLPVLLLTAALGIGAAAQPQAIPRTRAPSAAEQQRLADLESRFEELQSEGTDADAGVADDPPDAPAATAEAAFDAWVDTYTQRAYAWHHTSTIVIFWVVMLVVLSGVALATWQLANWMKRVRAYDEIFLQRLRKGGPADTEAINGVGKPPDSTLSLTKESVQLSSPYVGVVILGLSMGFFLAYLLLVYPIVQGP